MARFCSHVYVLKGVTLIFLCGVGACDLFYDKKDYCRVKTEDNGQKKVICPGGYEANLAQGEAGEPGGNGENASSCTSQEVTDADGRR